MKTQNSNDSLLKYTLGLIVNLSSYVMIIDETIHQLLKEDAFNGKANFQEFIMKFEKGKYYHIQCQGYLECLVVTQIHSDTVISYWVDNYVKPTLNYFTVALEFLDKVKFIPETINNQIFEKLIMNTNEFKKAELQLIDVIRQYIAL